MFEGHVLLPFLPLSPHQAQCCESPHQRMEEQDLIVEPNVRPTDDCPTARPSHQLPRERWDLDSDKKRRMYEKLPNFGKDRLKFQPFR